MRTEKEIKLKIEEIRNKAFDIIERSQSGAMNKRTSIRQIRLVIDALEYAIGNKKEISLFVEYDNKAKIGETI